ncbi:MAG: glycosyltransferase 87 family protein [Aquihabitans sp.]
MAFLILLCFWLASPFIVANESAQDGPAFAATAKTVVVPTALITPTVINIVTLGQNTGILLLAVCLGGAAIRRNRFDGLVVAAGVVYSAAIMLKVWPPLAVLVLLLRRRWHRFNRSVDETLHATIWPGLHSGFATTLTLLARVGLLGALWAKRV